MDHAPFCSCLTPIHLSALSLAIASSGNLLRLLAQNYLELLFKLPHNSPAQSDKVQPSTLAWKSHEGKNHLLFVSFVSNSILWHSAWSIKDSQ